MLRRLIEAAIRLRGGVMALVLLTVVYGGFVVSRARYDVFPDFASPQIAIQTEAPGLAPDQVEALVTDPIEQVLEGMGHLDSLRSRSAQGISAVTAVFEPGTDLLQARQLVSERLVGLSLPRGVKPPMMAPLSSATSLALTIGLTSDQLDPMALRTLADWTVRPQLLAVSGVSNVRIYGGSVRQLQIQVVPERLLARGLSLQDVVAAARQATGVRGAGFIETENQRLVIRTEGQTLTPAELGDVVLASHDGTSVRLRDVGNVVDAGAPAVGGALVQGRPGVILQVTAQYGANVLALTRRLDGALSDLRPVLAAQGVVLHADLFRPADFIRTALRNVTFSLVLGGILVVVVLFVFLYDWRTATISLTAIPLSLLVAIILLDRMGASLNTMTLGGLAIAIGEVVDDAIIDVENIFRRLMENRVLEHPRSAFQVVLDASLEVRSAVVYATFIVALVFLPVLAMTGIQGRLFAPLGLAYVLAIFASLGVALVVTPALCYLLLAHHAGGAAEAPFMEPLRQRYQALLARITGHPQWTIGAVALLCVATLATLPGLGSTFLPELHEGAFIVHLVELPGTSLAESLRLGRAVSVALLRIPGVRSVAQRAGRAALSEETRGPNASELDIELAPGADSEAVQAGIRKVLAGFPGVSSAVNTFLAERMNETISGQTAAVAVQIFGNDLDALDDEAKQVAAVLARVPGATGVQLQSPPGMPEEVVRLRPDRLVQLGFEPLDVLDAVQTAYQGTPVAQTFEGNRAVDVTVILDPADRQSPAALRDLLVSNTAGLHVPLGRLTDIAEDSSRATIVHQGGRRVQVVTCDVRGRDLGSFVAAARKRIGKEVGFASGTYPVFTGASRAQSQAERELVLNSLVAAVGILLLLWLAFRTWRNLALVFLNLPLALVGGILAVWASGGVLSLGALVGFVTLFGITTRNSIMLVSHYEHLVAVEGMAWGPAAAIRGAVERFRPIVMTALVTGLGLLPIAVGASAPGREIEGPMALVILGGLLTSTALNLLVLPTLALRFGRFGQASALEA